MENIIVIGGGGHAKVVISILKKINAYNILGYSDLINSGSILGINYLGNDETILDNYFGLSKSLVLGVGQIKTPEVREKLIVKFIKAGFNFPSIISPHAICNESVEIGEGTIIMDGVVINTVTKIGNYCIVNTNSTIEHDCNIGNYVHIAPGSTISGEVEIGSKSFIGAGTILTNAISIPDNCIIGAGSLVRNNINESGMYVGNPLKRFK
jgi:sugar O-acyltransferase (sialic acid O-acetyltransferase NeuD family)